MKKKFNIDAVLVAYIVAATVFLMALGLTGCGSDSVNSPDAEQQVKSCIAQGGDPKYTTDKYGYVITFLGCVKP